MFALTCVFSTVLLGHKEKAVQWYKRGITELERGIANEITGNGEFIFHLFRFFPTQWNFQLDL